MLEDIRYMHEQQERDCSTDTTQPRLWERIIRVPSIRVLFTITGSAPGGRYAGAFRERGYYTPPERVVMD